MHCLYIPLKLEPWVRGVVAEKDEWWYCPGWQSPRGGKLNDRMNILVTKSDFVLSKNVKLSNQVNGNSVNDL
jgi:hypothetical protein